jgi:uncharacterized protein YhjY with autotransporter beta-barrel domain
LNAGIYGGHNTYQSSRSGLGGLANGNTDGAEWSTFISGGYDFHFGQLIVGPIAALQYTYLNIDSFSENDSLAPLAIHSQSAESLRTDVGFRAYYIWQLGKVIIEPNLRAAWEHECKYSALPIIAGFAGIPGPSATFFGPNEGHDSAIVSAGVSIYWTPTIATYVNYDGQLGRNRYDFKRGDRGSKDQFLRQKAEGKRQKLSDATIPESTFVRRLNSTSFFCIALSNVWVRTQKKEVVFSDSLDEYPSQLDAGGESFFWRHRPTNRTSSFCILPSYFCLQTSPLYARRCTRKRGA